MATPSPTQAVRVSDFTNSIGINTHIDFTGTAYGNLQVVENSLNYIGVHNVRDSLNNPADVGSNGLWQQVHNATGATFDAFLPEGSPSAMQNSLQYIQQIAPQHILGSIEGGNEEDNTYATANGNSAAIAAQYQQTVYSAGQSLNLPVVNISFGSGWASNPTQGDYATVGNISAYSNYANAHIYYGSGNSPSYNISWVNGLAQISSSHPVIITETGWYTTGSTTDATSVSETVQAKYMLDALFDAYKAGDVKTYLYELLDQHSGDGYSEDNFGLFHSNGTPKLAATALHNMMSLLSDTGGSNATFAPGSLSYSLSGTTSSDNTMLMEKSDGSYWLSIWNETRLSGPTSPTDVSVPNQSITLNLANAANITVFDPLTGTTAVQTVNNASTVQISVPDHPVLVEIVPSGTSTGTSGTGTGSGAGTGTGTSSGTGTGAGSGSGTVTGTGSSSGGTLSSNDLSVTVPTHLSAATNGAVHVAASIADAWAAQNTGTMALNVTTTGGTVTMTDGSGNAVTGSGTNAIHLDGTLAQLNADLATLNFVAPNTAGTDTVNVNAWNQAGVQTTQSTSIDVTAATSGGTSTGGASTGGTSTGGALSSNDLSVAVPTSLSATTGSTSHVAASITDPWAGQHSGTMALNITTTGGAVTMTDGSGNAVAGSGTDAIHISGTLAQLNADLATLNFVAPNAAGTDTVNVNVWNQAGVQTTQSTAIGVTVSSTASSGGSTGSTLTSHDTVIATPASVSLTQGSGVQVTGVNVNDAWAANHTGTMALNVTAGSGTIAMTDGNGNAIAGSGTNAIHLNGTLAQINADLATLSYQASGSAGTDNINVNVWNQAGVSTTQLIAVNSLSPGNVTASGSGHAIVSGVTGGTLTGNGGGDTFYFTMQNTGNATTADHITNFSQAAGDKIDLHGFGVTAADFNSTGTLTGAKSFTFAQLTDASGHPYTQVTIDTNGDHQADYTIQLDNTHATLHASDFIVA